MKSKGNRNRKATETLPKSAQPSEKLPRLTKALDIPASALPGTPQIELAGNREAIIDGCQGVLEYDENVVKLSTGKMAIRFQGRNLQIKVLTHDSAIVEGFITSIEFVT